MIVSDLIRCYADVFEHFEQRFSIVSKCNCSVMRISFFDQFMAIEFRCGGGKLLFSSMGLQNLQQYPESRALLHAIYQYMDSEAFAPEEEISVEEMSELVK